MAKYLSEGECRLIAFCYFMAKLDDINTKNTKPVIWIDDPISSLDENHIFSIYSLIKTKILDTPDTCSQLFISTHNLRFLGLLKHIYDRKDKKIASFIVRRKLDGSILKELPKYLEKNITEYVYAFKQIYICARC